MWEHLGGILIGLGMLINAVVSVLTYLQANKTAEVVDKLEINTNSIKDALVKVTGESEFAKGKLEGISESKGG